MTDTPDRFFIRRGLIAGALAWAAPPAQAAARTRVVTILGDSITAGLGLRRRRRRCRPSCKWRWRGWACPALVRGAGVSGDTSEAGLARVDFSVQADTDVAVVALGGNDLLQGLDPKATQGNLQAIVRRLKARGMTVVLAGIRVPSAVGAGYARDFDAVFPSVARADQVALYPDLMAGVGPALRQGDGLHPNAAGARLIAAGLAPVLARALRARR